MAKVRGIVAKVEGKKCILLTPSGEFVKTARAPYPVKVGQEVELARDSTPWYRVAAVTAAVLLIGLLLPLFPLLTASAQPVAYLSVDINPSLELGVNKDGKVVQVKSFNQAGGALTGAAAVTNQGIYQAVQALIGQALKQGFLAQGKPNLIVAVYTDNAKFQFDKGKIQAAVQQEVVSAGIAAELVVAGASMDMHRQATADQISQGKYLVLNGMKERGKEISLENMRQDGINQALTSQGLNIADVAPDVKDLSPKAGTSDTDGEKAGDKDGDKDRGQQQNRPESDSNSQPDNGAGKGKQEKSQKPGMKNEKSEGDGDKGESKQESSQPILAPQIPPAQITSKPTLTGQHGDSGDTDQESRHQGD